MEAHDASREATAGDGEVNVDAAGGLAKAAKRDGAAPDPRTYGGFAVLSKGRQRVPDSEQQWVGMTSESDDLLGCITWPYVLFGWIVVTARYIVLAVTWPLRRLWRAVKGGRREP